MMLVLIFLLFLNIEICLTGKILAPDNGVNYLLVTIRNDTTYEEFKDLFKFYGKILTQCNDCISSSNFYTVASFGQLEALDFTTTYGVEDFMNHSNIKTTYFFGAKTDFANDVCTFGCEDIERMFNHVSTSILHTFSNPYDRIKKKRISVITNYYYEPGYDELLKETFCDKFNFTFVSLFVPTTDFLNLTALNHSKVPVTIFDMSNKNMNLTEASQMFLNLYIDQEKGDGFMEQFSSVMNPTSNFIFCPTDDVSEDELISVEFTKENVRKQLLKCSSKNMSGPDGIPGIILKKCARSLALPFSILFNYILDKGEVPDEFLLAHVTPIPKIPNPTLISDFRPISGTSDGYKTMERVIAEKLQPHLEKTKYLPNEQFGFRSGMSTTTQMILFQEFIVKEAAKGKTVDVIYLDMEKAFDKLTFTEIVNGLKKAKINGKLLNLIIIFLTQRKFQVKINGYKSESAEVTSGVGQGCVLSAILFIIVFAQISDFLNGFDFLKHFKFADDLKLLYSYFPHEFDPHLLQNVLNGLYDWCTAKSLSINGSKTVHVQFGKPNPAANYSINNIDIVTKEVTRDLGIYIKNDLSMNHHIETVYSTTNRKMHSVLKKVITNDPEILVKIFNIYIRPNYEYGSPLFNIPRKNIADDLEALQKTFTKRVFLRNNPNTNYDQILDYQERRLLYQMETLEKRRLFAQLLLAWEMLVKNKNEELDLDFHHNIAMETRFGGVYISKSNIPLDSKYFNYHFSSKIASILNHFQIKLYEFSSKTTLLAHLKTIDFSSILKIT